MPKTSDRSRYSKYSIRVREMSVDTGSVVGGVGIAMSIISMVYAAINHKRIRAKCCGRLIEMELDVTDTPHADPKKAGDRRSVKVHPEPPTAVIADEDVEQGHGSGPGR
jgi:hypothetical protein